MKGQKKSFFAIIFSFVLAITGFMFITTQSSTNLVYADDSFVAPSDYFSLKKYNKVTDGEDVTYNLVTNTQIAKNDAVFVGEDQVVIYRLGQLTAGSEYMIEHYNTSIYVDNQSVEIPTDALDSSVYIQKVSGTDYDYIEIILNPNEITYENQLTPDLEGKYTITITYQERSGLNYETNIPRIFTYSFYLFKNATYYSNNLPNPSISNVETFSAGTSAPYSRTHQFFYDNQTLNNQTLSLPVLSFDTTKFEINITKTVYGISQTSYVSLNSSNNLVQTSNIVKIYKNANTGYITFNDFGNYQINYVFIHRVDNEVNYLTNINSITKYDRLNLYGVQNYHTDINSISEQNRIEFKLFEEDNSLKIGYQTDVTFALSQANVTTTSYGSYTIINHSATSFDLNDEFLSPISTNQAPVEFDYNVAIVTSKSYVFKLNSYLGTVDETTYNKNLWTVTTNYSGQAISDAGSYLVKIVFTIPGESVEKTQWFMFAITNDTPTFLVNEVDGETTTLLSSNSYTNKTVNVSSTEFDNPFNSPTQLLVYSKTFTQSTYANEVVVLGEQNFSSDGNYKVILKFGKDLSKTKISYFTIDTTEISGLVARNVGVSTSTYTRSNAVSFFTNQNVVIEWNEKLASGNRTYGYYKYFPIKQKSTNYTVQELNQYYSVGEYVPVNYYLDYNGVTTIQQIPYSNTVSYSTLPSQSVLREQGLYLVYVYDQAGNEEYYSFVIDKTTPNVLQIMTEDDTIIDNFSSLNLVAKDTSIKWGLYKTISFSSLSLTNVNLNTWKTISGTDLTYDSWLIKMLQEKATLTQMNNDANCDFKTITVSGQTRLHLTPKIKNSQVEVMVNSTKTLVNQTNTPGGAPITNGSGTIIGYQITVAGLVGGELEVFENTYSFFVSDESQTLNTYSTVHSVQVSTDISKTAVRFYDPSNSITPYSGLVQHSYQVTNTETSEKSLYYMPINYPILELQYLTQPSLNAIELNTIILNYYPYISSYLIFKGATSVSYLTTGMYYTTDENITYTGTTAYGLTNGQTYTLQNLIESDPNLSYSNFEVGKSYVLKKEPIQRTIYSYSEGINLGSLINGLYVWEIETYFDAAVSESGTLLSKEGKYEFIRTYRTDLANVTELVGEENDFMTRKITFMIERQEIISSPITLDINPDPLTNNYQLINRVGGTDYIEVLSGFGLADNVFNELYRAKNYSIDNPTNILETNKLPVKVGITLQKFGELIGSNYYVFASNYFYADTTSSYINSFEILVQVKNLLTGSVVNQNYSVAVSNFAPESGSPYTYIRLDNGLYLIMSGISSNGYINLGTFTQVGQYQVTLSQNNANLKGYKYQHVMFFEIKNIAPSFQVEDTKGNLLNYDSATSNYYTNQSVIRIKWDDPTNPYLAKIDKTDISYYLNSVKYTVNQSNIIAQSNGYSYYFDLNIASVTDTQIVTIQMHYEGLSTYYTAGSFTATKNIVIDRIAPTQSLTKLIAKAGESTIINAANLREGHGQSISYNRTTQNTNSIFTNYAFGVDIADFESLIYSSTDNIDLRYMAVPNKYTDASYSELDPASPSALTEIKYTEKYHTILSIEDIADMQINQYYEITEIDLAGNITVYSIYLTDFLSYVASQPDEITSEYKFFDYTTSISQGLYLTPQDVLDSNFNSTIYAKGSFELNNINTNNYPWAIVTYNNIKYVYSPNLENGVYRWISSTVKTETTLSQEINLGLSRFNYTITVKNLPYNNVTLQVAVSNQNLQIQEPTGTNETFTITKLLANDVVYVDWKTITVWEYINQMVARKIIFVNGQEDPILVEPETEYSMSYYSTVGNITTFTTNARAGAHYRYRIVDNFDQTYTFHHIYGQTFVETITNLDGLGTIQTDMDDENQIYYLSNKGFNFTFYPSITQVQLTISRFNSTSGIGEIYTNSYTITGSQATWQDVNPQYATISLSTSGSYVIISLKPYLNSSSSIYEGEQVFFTIKATTNLLSSEEGSSEQLIEEEEYNFMIYNLLPIINLKGKNRQDMNSLFTENTNMTSEPISVEFASSSNFNYPVKVYVSFNGETEQEIQSGQIFTNPGTYTVRRAYTGAMSIFGLNTQTFVIADSTWQFYSVSVYSQAEGKYIDVSQTGEPYTTDETGLNRNIKIYSHFIVNSLDYRINLNTSQKMEILTSSMSLPQGAIYYYFTDTKNGVDTFVRTLSNYYSDDNNYVNYYETTIAITYIPVSNKIVEDFYYIDSAGVTQSLTYSEKTYAVEKELDTADSVIISWNTYYRIPENKIKVEIRYGQENSLISLSSLQVKNNTTSIVLNRSGYYTFTFSDKSGNIHKFNYSATIQNSTTSYELIYLKNVIFNVNSAPAIPYAIYNSDVVINIPSYTLGYYDSNARPKITVLRNGYEYTGYTYVSSNLSYTFTETGLYKITFAAKRQTKEIREESLYFQIVRENELAWAFDIEQYENYYIKQIIKNGTDVTRQLSNSSIGTVTNITTTTTETNGDVQTVTLPYLKNLLVSIYDEQTGVGNWTITVSTNNDLNQEFTFSFKINSAVPPLEISLPESESTTNTIMVRFNARNLFDEVGDVIVRISNYEDIVLNAAYFEDSTNPTIFEIELSKVGDHYIQLYTPSERLIYSYRVTRDQPLNSIAIVLIVASSFVVVGLTFMFILLRKKMQIR